MTERRTSGAGRRMKPRSRSPVDRAPRRLQRRVREAAIALFRDPSDAQLENLAAEIDACIELQEQRQGRRR